MRMKVSNLKSTLIRAGRQNSQIAFFQLAVSGRRRVRACAGFARAATPRADNSI